MRYTDANKEIGIFHTWEDMNMSGYPVALCGEVIKSPFASEPMSVQIKNACPECKEVVRQVHNRYAPN